MLFPISYDRPVPDTTRQEQGRRPGRRWCGLTNAIPSVLLGGGRGNGIAVVPTEEDDGTLEGGGEVEASMGIPLTGCPLAEVTNDNPVGIGSLGRIGRPHSCRAMRGQ